MRQHSHKFYKAPMTTTNIENGQLANIGQTNSNWLKEIIAIDKMLSRTTPSLNLQVTGVETLYKQMSTNKSIQFLYSDI